MSLGPFIKLPKPWASLEGSTLLAHRPSADRTLLRNATIMLPALQWARNTHRKGFTVGPVRQRTGFGREKVAQILGQLADLGLVEHTNRKKADGRLQWYRLTDEAQCLVDAATTSFYMLKSDTATTIQRATWLSLWVAALREARPTITAAEVVRMLQAPRSSVYEQFSRPVLVIENTGEKPNIVADDKPSLFIIANTEQAVNQMLDMLPHMAAKADDPGAIPVYVNGQWFIDIAPNEIIQGRRIATEWADGFEYRQAVHAA
jgi:hypothetical protein